jgi:hypothetical protein
MASDHHHHRVLDQCFECADEFGAKSAIERTVIA